MTCQHRAAQARFRERHGRRPDSAAVRERANRRKRVVRSTPEGKRKRWAQNQVRWAIKTGALVRGECEVGVDCKGPIEAHHDDYAKPLDVRWLCRRHHIEVG